MRATCGTDARPRARPFSAAKSKSSSPTGTQFVQAVGSAEAGRYLDPKSDAITLVTSGEGATSEGEFWEAVNIACLERLPIIYLVEDNGYAISVPVEKQTAGGDISKLVSGFPDLKLYTCDGTDFIASYNTWRYFVTRDPLSSTR